MKYMKRFVFENSLRQKFKLNLATDIKAVHCKSSENINQ